LFNKVGVITEFTNWEKSVLSLGNWVITPTLLNSVHHNISQLTTGEKQAVIRRRYSGPAAHLGPFRYHPNSRKSL